MPVRSALAKTRSQKQVGRSLKSLSKHIFMHLPGQALRPALVKPKGITAASPFQECVVDRSRRGSGTPANGPLQSARVLQGALAQGSRETVEKA